MDNYTEIFRTNVDRVTQFFVCILLWRLKFMIFLSLVRINCIFGEWQNSPFCSWGLVHRWRRLFMLYYLLVTMWMQKFLLWEHIQSQPPLNVLCRNECGQKNVRPFKTWIEATPVIFSEKEAGGCRNCCKQAMCLFSSSLLLFRQWQMMGRATPKSLVAFLGFFSIVMSVFWAHITQTIHILVIWL